MTAKRGQGGGPRKFIRLPGQRVWFYVGHRLPETSRPVLAFDPDNAYGPILIARCINSCWWSMIPNEPCSDVGYWMELPTSPYYL